MASGEFRERLVALAAEAKIAVPPAIVEPLETYLDLLSQWNAKINLTSLPLRPPSDETVRRLLLEPLEAAPHISRGSQNWFDIGSGGGSPAIPLKLARPELDLSMVESKTKKAAFLREVIRTLGLTGVTVFGERLDDVVSRSALHHRATLVTLRAVRLDSGLLRAAWQLIDQRGELLAFCSTTELEVPELLPWFSHRNTVLLRASASTRLACYTPVFHVEQTS
ncbi:MAG: 16S rRNA (guanine(527)-N(7))-methyltransferase RsmG [Acidobacteriia bacterium]|nr:16S rRNA (guanine(527)-N(7))-methyltransferase RsmG [Terriglobia bacterium]